MLAFGVVATVVLLIAWRSPEDGRVAALPWSGHAASAFSGVAPRGVSLGSLADGPFDSVRTVLVSSANAGDADAAYRLGHVTSSCLKYVPIADGVFDTMIAKAGTIVGLSIFGRRIDDEDVLDVLLYSKDEMDRTCAGTDELRRSGRVAEAYPWIHRAAELGHTGAMAEYADHAFTEFASHADLLDHAAEVARRRELATKMLDRALLAGEPKALKALAKAHHKGGILQRDPMRALAYWLAYRETTHASMLPPGLQRMGDEHYRQALDPVQQAQAESLAMALLADLRAASPGS